MGEIANCERQLAAISDRLLPSTSDSVRARIKRLREQAMDRIRDLREYLNTDTPRRDNFWSAISGKSLWSQRATVTLRQGLGPTWGPADTLGWCRGRGTLRTAYAEFAGNRCSLRGCVQKSSLGARFNVPVHIYT